MAINSIYFINAATLSLATSVYLDGSLLYLAPDGFYSMGGVVRQQSGGILLPEESCAICPVDCGFKKEASSSRSISIATVGLGATTGAVIISFTSNTRPKGIKVTYNSIIYNKLSSAGDGLHQSTTYGNFTVVGDSDFDCGLEGNTTVLVDLPEFGLSESGWYSTGNLDTIIVNPGDVSLSVPSLSDRDPYIMVIPKPNATPDTMTIEVLNACGEETSEIVVVCPAELLSFLGSEKYTTNEVPCSEETITYYVAQVHPADANIVGLYDYIFTDINGQYPLADGWYKVDSASQDVMRIEDGIVVELTPCFSSCVQYQAEAGLVGGTVEYNDCSGTPTSINVLPESTQNFCANLGEITNITGDVTINILGDCP